VARLDIDQKIQVQALRRYVADRRGARGADPALLLYGALRSRLREIGPPRPSHGSESPRPLTGRGSTFAIRVGGRWYPWELVRALLRAALEVDRPLHERSQEARDLAAFLWSDRPTTVQYALARPALMRIWHALHSATARA
jgi:hypothetical protein